MTINRRNTKNTYRIGRGASWLLALLAALGSYACAKSGKPDCSVLESATKDCADGGVGPGGSGGGPTAGTGATSELGDEPVRGAVTAPQPAFYEFSVVGNQIATIVISEATANLEFALIDGDEPDNTNKVMYVGAASAATDMTVVALLPPGTYRARVKSSQPADFEIAVDLETYLPAEGSPGEKKASASDVGDLSETAMVVGGYVGQKDAEDYYRFVLTENGTLTITGTETIGHVNVDLLLDDGSNDATKVHGRLQPYTKQDGTLSIHLEKGTYYVRVTPTGCFGCGADAFYTLSFGATYYENNASEPKEDANRKEDALTLHASEEEAVAGYVGQTDEEDYYRIEIAENSELALSLTGCGPRTDLCSGGLGHVSDIAA